VIQPPQLRRPALSWRACAVVPGPAGDAAARQDRSLRQRAAAWVGQLDLQWARRQSRAGRRDSGPAGGGRLRVPVQARLGTIAGLSAYAAHTRDEVCVLSEALLFDLDELEGHVLPHVVARAVLLDIDDQGVGQRDAVVVDVLARLVG